MVRANNQQIVRELKEGDQRGCRHLIEAYQDRLLAEAVHVFQVPLLDAEELVSDVLLTVVTKVGTFQFKRSDGDFHYWVMTIFRNRVRDFMRRRGTTEGLQVHFDEAALEDDEAYSSAEREVVRTLIRRYEDSLRSAGGPDRDAGTDDAGKLHVVIEVLDELETWERVLLRCRALGIPYEEIAHYTEKPAKQLKVYLARVKKKFLKLLAERIGETP
jgi:RNA polymerase sigma factor (sigma-70 family)